MENIITYSYKVNKDMRQKIKKHQSMLIWFTGLSGSGKSTLANALELELHKRGVHTYSLDGDNTRAGINKDLTFRSEDRTENIRRVSEIANLMIDAGIVVLAAFVSPYKKDRAQVKSVVGENNFIEVFVSTSIEECEKRDVKGLYKKARAGEIKNMTGIDDMYEAPLHADLNIDTKDKSVEESVNLIFDKIKSKLNLK
ncbi:MAG: adenylyl-sulfate kinase [Flavobacteriaceae bacterium]|nr:adenylyl-sulfate kinase [Flavobacteriaceae bacterium]